MRLLTNPSPELYRTWTAGLQDIPDGGLALGMKRVKDFKGYFCLPAFRDLCRMTPEAFGLPSAKAAYLEASAATGVKDRVKWSHPAVYYAGMATGWFELRSFTEKEIFPRFELHYTKLCESVMRGERLDMPRQQALPEKIPAPCSLDENRKRIGRIKAMLEESGAD